jgi:perosamine synthetase
MNQLKRLSAWVKRRQEIAKRYDIAFSGIPEIAPLGIRKNVSHAYHLYVIRLNPEKIHTDRATIFRALRAEGIGVNVHYIPVHLHPFYQQNLGTKRGMYPVAEKAYEEILSLPMFPKMHDNDVNDVITAVQKVIRAFS